MRPGSIPSTERSAVEVRLTAAQQAFATAHDATPGTPGTMGGVFLYEASAARTIRWLVNDDGSLLDVVSFHR